MDLVPALVVGLARAKGSGVDLIKLQYGIAPEELGCLRGLSCGLCRLCPKGGEA